MEADDNIPLALRRSRRSNFGVRVTDAFSDAAVPPTRTPKREHGLQTPRKTNTSRRLRFSDPGLSTGLTPFLRRSDINTPRGRRVSMPQVSSTLQRQPRDNQCIHNIRDGRVERRERRGATREAVGKVEAKHRHATSRAKSEISHLQDQLRSRDREIYELRNATIVVDTDRIWQLEGQIDALKADLRRAQSQDRHRNSFMAPDSPTQPFTDIGFGHNGGPEQTWFDDTTGIIAGTPSRRAQDSFPSPPATSPMAIPETPSSRSRSRTHLAVPPTPISATAHAGVQACLLNPDVVDAQAVELESLRREVGRLMGTLDEHRRMMERLAHRIPQPQTESDASDSGSTTEFEQQIAGLLDTLSEKTTSLSGLTSAISSLGFPGGDAPEMLGSISVAFRQARLELEYLSPGECALPLSHHGAEVLDLVLTQLRELARKLQERENTIDEYHAGELSLRQQLSDRVSFAERLREGLDKANCAIEEKDTRIHELEFGNDRLKGAINGYLRDISELERLVERMEAEAANNGTGREAAADGAESEQQSLIRDLESRIDDATKSASELRDELDVVKASRKKQLNEVNKRNGQALALRDARVAELRGEVDRVNGALSHAHWEIHRLRAENKGLHGDNEALRAVVDDIKRQLLEVETTTSEAPLGSGHLQPGRLLSGKLARRSSSSRRTGRRVDSGIGFIDEDEAGS